MPRVGEKHFDYSAGGIAAANRYAKELGTKVEYGADPSKAEKQGAYRGRKARR